MAGLWHREQCRREVNPTVLPGLVPSAFFRVSSCEQHFLAQERVVSSQCSLGLDLLPMTYLCHPPKGGDGRERAHLFIA